ncbi:MAG: tungsten cofactor oxidoreductase radical SAM maturase [Chloroflexi bacterium HGW-Chloroflexi-10]|nr:MAG: tungsten cofactor oxidoreductase radical SAM maturase [Chloroflexi bacterium HGW-Chloroflexi-10]
MKPLKPDSQNKIILPAEFLQRRHLDPQTDFWLNEREGDLILHPRLPDVHKLYIEATTSCNLSCQTCIRHSWTDPNAHMDNKTFQSILNSLDDLPLLDRVVFTSFGEPLVHAGLLDMIAGIRARGLGVTLGSNGLLLNEKNIRELVRLGVDNIIVSIDGGKPETYEGVRGTQLSRVLENIRLMNRIKQELGVVYPVLGIEFVAMRSNQDELQDLIQLASQLNAARLVVSHVLPYSREMEEEKLYGYGLREGFKTGSWPVHSDAWMRWGVIELPRMHWGAERRCRFVQDRSIVVGWDGGISPCYALSHSYQYFAIDGIAKQVERYVLGNVRETPLAEIWMSEEYTRFRSDVRVFHFPSCPDCDLRETCDLRASNQGCWGLNPSCADCLWAQDIVRCP